MTTDLVTWLRQQLDEDERGVREWTDPQPSLTGWLLSSPLRAVHELTDRVGKRRMLAEVDAKRRILDAWPDPMGQWTADQADAGRVVKDRVLRLLALPYADRPGYREEWRP